MNSKTWLCTLTTAFVLCGTGSALARDHGYDHGHSDHGHSDHDRGWHGDHDHGDHGRHNDDHGRDHHDYDHREADHHVRYYQGHEEVRIREWYRGHYRHLPPGLAKRDRLPPGIERQLVVRGTLPPGLRMRIRPCPPELVRELPPPPPHCEHVFIGGNLVLLNRSNFQVVDVFHFQL